MHVYKRSKTSFFRNSCILLNRVVSFNAPTVNCHHIYIPSYSSSINYLFSWNLWKYSLCWSLSSLLLSDDLTLIFHPGFFWLLVLIVRRSILNILTNENKAPFSKILTVFPKEEPLKLFFSKNFSFLLFSSLKVIIASS